MAKLNQTTSAFSLRSSLQRLNPGLPPAYWLLWLGTLINRLGGFVVPGLVSRRALL